MQGGLEVRECNMARKSELFDVTLERIRNRADNLYPQKLLYSQKEAAVIMGVSAKTLSRKGLSNLITAEQLAKAFS